MRARLSREKSAGDGAADCFAGEPTWKGGRFAGRTSCGCSLCSLPGVGAKVANCVMLFAYERLRAFPIDVWIERVLKGAIFSA